MSGLFQALESRMLLTATSTSLAAEMAAINTSGSAVKADLKLLTSTAKADLFAIGKDLKGSPATNVPLFKKLPADEKKFFTKVSADVNALLMAAVTSKKSAADGNASIQAPTNLALTAKVTADTTALLTAATKPQAKLTTDSSTATIDADISALSAANPTLATLLTQDATAKHDFDTGVAKLLTDAGTFTNKVDALKVDLSTLLPVPTVTPSLVGDYKGVFKTKPIVFGLGSLTLSFEILITSQTINSVTGTITAEGNSASGTIVAKELSNGKLSLTLVSPTLTISLSGVVNVTTTSKGLPPGSQITGSGTATIAGYSISGLFNVIKVT